MSDERRLPPRMTLEQASQLLCAWLGKNPESPQTERPAIQSYRDYFALTEVGRVSPQKFRALLLARNQQFKRSLRGRIFERVHGQSRPEAAPAACKRVAATNGLRAIFPEAGLPYLEGFGDGWVAPVAMSLFPNSISDSGLEMLGMFPGATDRADAEPYQRAQETCRQVTERIKHPLYFVNANFPLVQQALLADEAKPEASALAGFAAHRDARGRFIFPMEKFMEEFLVVNWEKTELARTLDIYRENGAPARQYHTDVGAIDLLARGKNSKDWVVIELKKGRESDIVVGQIMRYMGWVKTHLAKPREQVRGIIITGEPDTRMNYALRMSRSISFYSYRLNFSLVEQSH